jgi:hypothetical protein
VRSRRDNPRLEPSSCEGTLSKIAKAEFGDGGKYMKIFEANQDR